MIDLGGRVVLVTGAAGGLGSAYAEMLVAHGATVIAHDGGVSPDGANPDDSRIAAVAREWKSRGIIVDTAAQDLSTATECTALIDEVIARHGHLDALVHSAGIVRYGGIEATSADDWQRMLSINVSAAWWLCRAVWPHMRTRAHGRIVLTVSAYGLRAYDGSDVTAYGVGKAAQFGLMNGLAGEGRGHGILVNAIEPVAATRIFRAATDPDELTAASVAPAVVALVANECQASARVVNAADGEFQVQSYPPSSRRLLQPGDPASAVLALVNAD